MYDGGAATSIKTLGALIPPAQYIYLVCVCVCIVLSVYI